MQKLQDLVNRCVAQRGLMQRAVRKVSSHVLGKTGLNGWVVSGPPLLCDHLVTWAPVLVLLGPCVCSPGPRGRSAASRGMGST